MQKKTYEIDVLPTNAFKFCSACCHKIEASGAFCLVGKCKTAHKEELIRIQPGFLFFG